MTTATTTSTTTPRLNPIAQMKQRKGTQTAHNRTETATKAQGKAKAQAKPKTAQNSGYSRLPLPQISRMFDQTNAGTEHCKANFPDCYHFKYQLAKECEQVADGLHNGALLLAQLVQMVGYQALNHEQKAILKQFASVKNYLVGNLRTTAKHVQAVEDGTAKKCYAERFKPMAETRITKAVEGEQMENKQELVGNLGEL